MSIRYDALPAMAQLWDALVDATGAAGVVIAVADYGGFRTAADTADILNIRDSEYATYLAHGGTMAENDWRPIAQFGHSFHDYGAARDVSIVSKPANMTGLAAVATVDQLAESLGLETGASYGDPLHVQLPISLDEAQGEWADYLAAGGDAGASSSSSSSAAPWIILAAAVGAVVTVRHSKGLSSWR